MAVKKNDSLCTLMHLHEMLSIYNENSSRQFCTINNYSDVINTLFDELDAFEVIPLSSSLSPSSSKSLLSFNNTSNNNLNTSIKTLECILVKLMNSTWNLIYKHRNLMGQHEELKNQHSRVLNDNSGYANQIKRLKQTIEKKDNTMSEIEERERQLKIQVNNLTRELKREKEESVKLRKQINSKDTQHAHELRRIQLNGNKLRDQLQKSVGKYVPNSKSTQNLQTDNENKIRLYKQTINRLEENNNLMLQEINDLKDALSLHAGGLELHVESSGIWDDTTT